MDTLYESLLSNVDKKAAGSGDTTELMTDWKARAFDRRNKGRVSIVNGKVRIDNSNDWPIALAIFKSIPDYVKWDDLSDVSIRVPSYYDVKSYKNFPTKLNTLYININESSPKNFSTFPKNIEYDTLKISSDGVDIKSLKGLSGHIKNLCIMMSDCDMYGFEANRNLIVDNIFIIFDGYSKIYDLDSLPQFKTISFKYSQQQSGPHKGIYKIVDSVMNSKILSKYITKTRDEIFQDMCNGIFFIDKN